MLDLSSIELIPIYVGLSFLVLGFILFKFPPKKINYFYGYRTPASMRNQKNWDFSQVYSAKQLMISGALLILIDLISIILNWHVFNKSALIAMIVVTAVLHVLHRTEYAIKKINK
jgi:uncharacterized membrane protein